MKSIRGKENKLEMVMQDKNGNMFEMKSHSFTTGNNKDYNRKLQKQVSYDEDDGLDVRFVNDIDSLVPPRYNPNTRTYFKCSL